MDQLTTKEASVILGVSRRRVIALIEQGKLKARKFSNVYIIAPNDLEKVKCRRSGRPETVPTEHEITGPEEPFETIYDLVPDLSGSITVEPGTASSTVGRSTSSRGKTKIRNFVSFAEAAAKYIGCIDDSLPTDLSTNKKYMEGFGVSRTDLASNTIKQKRKNGKS